MSARPSIKRPPHNANRSAIGRQIIYLPASVSRRVPTDSRLTASRLATLSDRHHVAPFRTCSCLCVRICLCLAVGLCVPAPSIIWNAVQPRRWLPHIGYVRKLGPHCIIYTTTPRSRSPGEQQIQTSLHVCCMHCEFPLGLDKGEHALHLSLLPPPSIKGC